MDASAKINDSFLLFVSAYLDLLMYVKNVQKGLQQVIKTSERLERKLKKRKSSSSSRRSLKSTTISVVLSDEELTVLQASVKEAVSRVRKHPTLLLNMAFIYLLAIFEAFLADVFRVVLQARPEMLRSNKQLTYQAIVSLGSKDELISHMAARELHEIGYGSTRDQWSYYRDRFGVDLAKAGIAIEKLIEMYAERNLLVHNNGLVNNIYLESVRTPKFKKGGRVEITLDAWNDFAQTVEKAASFVKKTLLRRFFPMYKNSKRVSRVHPH